MEKLKGYLSDDSKFIVFILIGIPGSGKSTWIKNNCPNLPVISVDKIKNELKFSKNIEDKNRLTSSQVRELLEEKDKRIKEISKKRKSFVIDDMNIYIWRRSLIKTLRDYGATVIGIKLDTPLDICIKRRENQISKEVMTNMYNIQLSVSKEEFDDLFIIKYKENEDSKN